MRDHEPVIFEEFNGLFDRGDRESCPKDHFSACNNIKFFESGFETRDGLDTMYLTFVVEVQRIHPYIAQGSKNLLILTTGGVIRKWNAGSGITGPILTIILMTDFNTVSIAGRALITPFYTDSDGIETGIPGEFLYIYDGTSCRKAAGFPPTNGSNLPFVAFNSAVDGGWDKGIHVIAVAYQVAGVDGIKGPEIFEVVNAPGGKQIQLTNIPIHSVGATERIIVATKAIDPKDYVANQLSYTYYEVIRIPDNITKNLAVSITDVALTVPYVEGATPAPVTNALLAANSAVDGFADAGLHLFAVVAETDTGYLTAPGPELFAALTTVDIKKGVALTNIPLGPITTVRRHIVATKRIMGYTGNQFGYQFFFVPGGTLNDNVTTSLDVSFYDIDLLEDASHLIDNFSEVPAGVGICTYHGRLVLTTESGNISLARVSHPGEPEAFDQVDGLIIAPLDGAPLTNCQEFRDTLYLHKITRTIAVTDNNDYPSSWVPVVLDQAFGTSVHGIAAILDSGGVNVDYLLVAGYSGIMLFNGAYSIPELSYKVAELWENLDRTLFRRIEVVNDTIGANIYCVLPDYTILHGDYTKGLTPKEIKWTPWSFDVPITTIELTDTDKLVMGAIANASLQSGFYHIVPNRRHDTLYNNVGTEVDVKIPDPYIHTTLINEKGSAREGRGSDITHFTGVHVRVNGTGNLRPRLFGFDDTPSQTLVPLGMTNLPGRELFRLSNFQVQRAALELKTTEMDEFFHINRIIMYAKAVFAEFPA